MESLRRADAWRRLKRNRLAVAGACLLVLVTLLCIEWGRPGWFVLGGVIALASALMVPASAWALRSREHYGVLTHSG